MKTQMKVKTMKAKNKMILGAWSFLILGSILPGTGNASVVQDVNEASAKLLGHAAKVTNVFESQKLGLNRMAAKFQPWSGAYWPDINGGIANHYRDHGKFGDQILFLLRYGIAKGRVRNDFKNVCTKFGSFSEEELNQKLSPAEKYDLLLGDTNFTFAKAVLEDIDFRAHYLKKNKMKDGEDPGDDDQYVGINNNYHYADVQSSYSHYDNEVSYRYWKKRGDSISYWFGICDGWSPASIYLPRPEKPVTVVGALGHRITFYPDDLKALGSYLFARTNNDYLTTMNYQFAGRPCAEHGEPNGDQVGYVKDFRCNDLDAGLWHMILLNRIGVDRMGFMMDIDNNHKINNHPLGSYQLTYFNPATGEEGTLKNSVVSRYEVSDGYAKRRNPKTAYLVGVKSTIQYRYYQWPEDNRDRSTDHPSDDIVKDLNYVYDLELDANGNILGGEWGDRSKENIEDGVKYAKQPDFIWMSAPNLLPFSEESVYTVPGTPKDPSNPRPFGNMNWAWNGKGAMPEDWVRAAKADEMWHPPVVGEMKKSPNGDKQVFRWRRGIR
jgi:hypothetical protein